MEHRGHAASIRSRGHAFQIDASKCDSDVRQESNYEFRENFPIEVTAEANSDSRQRQQMPGEVRGHSTSPSLRASSIEQPRNGPRPEQVAAMSANAFLIACKRRILASTSAILACAFARTSAQLTRGFTPSPLC
jgi:hypothetical protein